MDHFIKGICVLNDSIYFVKIVNGSECKKNTGNKFSKINVREFIYKLV